MPMGNNSDDFFDFFDIRNNGELQEKTHIPDGKGGYQDVVWKGGFLEDFEFGWNVETTYGIYRQRIEPLLALAEQQEPRSTAAQALLSSAIVLAVSGLETLICTVGKLKKAPDQSIQEHIKIVEKAEGYKPIDLKDVAPLGRMFSARHAIIHRGWRLTKSLQKQIDKRAPMQKELIFGVAQVRRVIEAADRFATSVKGCFPELPPLEDSEQEVK